MLVLLAFAAFFAVPLIWLALASTKTGYQLVSENPFAVGSFHTAAAAWRALDGFNDHIYRRWFANSLYYALGGTALTIATVLPAGYGLAVGRFPGRRLLLGLTLVTMLVPATALVLPIFLELNGAGLLGHAAAVILPFAFFPFGVYLSYLYYSTALPPSLLDAARIDGCSEWQVFRCVALPLATPVVGLVCFLSFTANWSNFFLPFVALTDPRQYTIQVGLTDILTTASRPEIALATLIAAVPLAIVFVICQSTLRHGLFGSALKE
jgi:multiple sugar transport system permease protein